ncbi:alpha/beta hydrolase [Promicromonospora vindobonensis]|uniref:Alpha/beta hydrolase n=1 Tax=Promicromonospora vindobonensis TaxID=195748 RepID=A0ABW5VZX9_9MICO
MSEMKAFEAATTAPRTKRIRPAAPQSVSEQAQRMLSLPDAMSTPSYPDHTDTSGWLALVESIDNVVRPFYEVTMPPRESFTVTESRVGQISNYVIRPLHVAEEASTPIFIEIHGGGLYAGGGELAWMAGAAHAVDRAGLTWAPDYRMPPLHPFPTALDDLLEVYRAALELCHPSQILVSGASGGGNLAAALILRIKDAGLPVPAALVLLTPEVDLTESGDSFLVNDGIDNLLTSLMPVNLLYANGVDLAHPHVSPLFGDLSGFPPTLLQSGTRDLFLSNTVRMHRALLATGTEAELHIWEAMPHGGFGGTTPEDDELRAEVRRFEAIQLARASATPREDYEAS